MLSGVSEKKIWKTFLVVNKKEKNKKLETRFFYSEFFLHFFQQLRQLSSALFACLLVLLLVLIIAIATSRLPTGSGVGVEKLLIRKPVYISTSRSEIMPQKLINRINQWLWKKSQGCNNRRRRYTSAQIIGGLPSLSFSSVCAVCRV